MAMRESLFAFVLFASAASAEAQDKDKLVAIGELVFYACYPCHLVGDAKIAKVGPHLNDLFGRKPGSVPDFKYSQAMIEFGQNHVWDEATLTSYLRDTQSVVPGNNMKPFRFKKEAEIQSLLAYLATFDPGGMAAP
jgi:cytochrome c2